MYYVNIELKYRTYRKYKLLWFKYKKNDTSICTIALI
jgi:hypothetical protein